jgi:ABC transporter substrate binding protein
MRSWLGIVPDVMRNRALIPNLIGAAKLPAIYPFFELVEAGGLMAYAFDLVELNKRAANDIDAILRGANPGDIPFYQASKFELSINLKTSKSLGLTVRTILLGQRRQGDRKEPWIAAAHESGCGTFRTRPVRQMMSAFGGIAEAEFQGCQDRY